MSNNENVKTAGEVAFEGALRTLELLRRTNKGAHPSPSAEDLFVLAEEALTWALDELFSLTEDDDADQAEEDEAGE